MIEIAELHKSFDGKEVLAGIDLSVKSGEKVMLTGQNGAGKTTLIRCILGEYKPTLGTVIIDGVSPFKDRVKALCNISFVPQTPPPLKFTISELIEYSAGVSSFEKQDVVDYCKELDLDILPHLTKPFHRLSGGMKQKVLISIAFARKTGAIIFDEPTANLDIKGREVFRKLLERIGADKTFVFISHRIEEFSGIATRAIELDMGRVVKDENI